MTLAFASLVRRKTKKESRVDIHLTDSKTRVEVLKATYGVKVTTNGVGITISGNYAAARAASLHALLGREPTHDEANPF